MSNNSVVVVVHSYGFLRLDTPGCPPSPRGPTRWPLDKGKVCNFSQYKHIVLHMWSMGIMHAYCLPTAAARLENLNDDAIA